MLFLMPYINSNVPNETYKSHCNIYMHHNQCTSANNMVCFLTHYYRVVLVVVNQKPMGIVSLISGYLGQNVQDIKVAIP